MKGIADETAIAELRAQIENPTPDYVWNRALDVFGNEAKARHWFDTPRDIFGGQSPQALLVSAKPENLRLILKVLLRIDYGVYS